MNESLRKWLTTPAAHGYSNCIDRGAGNGLPNCVALAWGLFYYFHGQRRDFSKRPRVDAGKIYEACKKDGSGFWVRKAVKENSILCFNNSALGHVVYCLCELPDGVYLCLESNYSGTLKNGKYLRCYATKNPEKLYKGYQGCVYDFTD